MHLLLRAARRLFVGASMLYCILVVALALLWELEVVQVWWMELLSIFAPYLFVPLLLVVPFALISQSRALRLAAIPPVLVFVLLFGTQLVPDMPPAPTGTRLRVLTINQLYSNQRVEAFVETLRAHNADLVAVQELSPTIATALAEYMAAEYPYQVLWPARNATGRGLLSRYPIAAVEELPGFAGQYALIDVDGQHVHVINVHLPAPRLAVESRQRGGLAWRSVDYDTSRRVQHLPALLQAIDAIDAPLVALGDFNFSEREAAYAPLAERMRDAYRETSWGFGFTYPRQGRAGPIPIVGPLVRIDYVWVKGGVVPLSTYVACADSGSDHCAVVADLLVDT